MYVVSLILGIVICIQVGVLRSILFIFMHDFVVNIRQLEKARSSAVQHGGWKVARTRIAQSFFLKRTKKGTPTVYIPGFSSVGCLDCGSL